jgi:selenocysteine lyase/cysteine desulfurase
LGIRIEHEQVLAKKFLDLITSRSDVRLIGRHESNKDIRVPTLSFASSKMGSEEITRAVAGDKVAISSGHFHAKHLLESLAVEDTEDGFMRALWRTTTLSMKSIN